MSSLGLALKIARASSEQSSDIGSFKEDTEHQGRSLWPHRRDVSPPRFSELSHHMQWEKPKEEQEETRRKWYKKKKSVNRNIK